MKNLFQWRVYIALALTICIVALSPIALVPHKEPMLAGIPYALWVSILLTILLVLLTYLGAKVQPVDETPKTEK